jgi:drug/metabolite transporter (DMT)-like permease
VIRLLVRIAALPCAPPMSDANDTHGSSANDTHGGKRAWRAVLALSAVTMIWGGTFVWMKECMATARVHLGERGPTSGLTLFMALRFGVAAIVVIAISPAARRSLSGSLAGSLGDSRGSSGERDLGRACWSTGFLLSLPLCAGFALQMTGLDELLPAVSAFLTSLYVLFTAAIMAVLAKRGVRIHLAVGAVLATAGAGLVRGRPELGFTLAELFTVGGALAFAVHLLLTHRYTKRLPPMGLTVTSFAWVALFNLVAFAIVQMSPGRASWDAIGALLRDPIFLQNLAWMCLLGTVVALSLMNLYQRELDPVRASILYALEPIWAALFGVACGLDRFTGWLVVGGAILLCGNLVAELGGRTRSM